MKTLLFLILYCLVVALAEKPKETNQDEKNQEQQKNELISDDQEHLQSEKKEKRSRACHPKCGTGFFHAAGKCNTKTGRCACHWGWTGPRSKFVSKNSNRIEAKFCTQPCHYTHDFRNKDCTFKRRYRGHRYGKRYTYRNYYQYHNGHKTVGHYDEYHCHYKCGYGIYHAAGRCAGYGLCLCWWGWTGAGAQYLDEGEYAGRVVAYYCTKPCTYGPFYKNPACGYIPKKHDSVAHESTAKRD